jgi:hypothetical protein
MIRGFVPLLLAGVLHNGMYKHKFISADSHSVCGSV